MDFEQILSAVNDFVWGFSRDGRIFDNSFKIFAVEKSSALNQNGFESPKRRRGRFVTFSKSDDRIVGHRGGRQYCWREYSHMSWGAGSSGLDVSVSSRRNQHKICGVCACR